MSHADSELGLAAWNQTHSSQNVLELSLSSHSSHCYHYRL